MTANVLGWRLWRENDGRGRGVKVGCSHCGCVSQEGKTSSDACRLARDSPTETGHHVAAGECDFGTITIASTLDSAAKLVLGGDWGGVLGRFAPVVSTAN
nr:hypothetical protein CFP56_73206 [Quercus suber]